MTAPATPTAAPTAMARSLGRGAGADAGADAGAEDGAETGSRDKTALGGGGAGSPASSSGAGAGPLDGGLLATARSTMPSVVAGGDDRGPGLDAGPLLLAVKRGGRDDVGGTSATFCGRSRKSARSLSRA